MGISRVVLEALRPLGQKGPLHSTIFCLSVANMFLLPHLGGFFEVLPSTSAGPQKIRPAIELNRWPKLDRHYSTASAATGCYGQLSTFLVMLVERSIRSLRSRYFKGSVVSGKIRLFARKASYDSGVAKEVTHLYYGLTQRSRSGEIGIRTRLKIWRGSLLMSVRVRPPAPQNKQLIPVFSQSKNIKVRVSHVNLLCFIH